jgi:phospholipid/cholesterol/gamma-HCH transport system substrate-binding protein
VIRRSVKIRVVAFVVLSLLGVSYLSLNYIGLGARLFGGQYTVSADFADSGGIFPNAEVTYRGVPVGRVAAMHLLPDGVRVDLRIDPHKPRIPASAKAVVTDRSAVGEQFVDLVPAGAGGPYLEPGAVIPMSRNQIPTSTQTLLLNLDLLVRGVDRRALATVVDELGTAFAGTGTDLQQLLDYGDQLLTAASAALPQTIRLIDDSRTVLETVNSTGAPLRNFARQLRLLTGALRAGDPDLRRVLANGPPAVSELTGLIRDNRTDAGVLLANLLTTSDLLVRRVNGVRQVLSAYPAVAAGGYTTVLPGGAVHFGLVLNSDDPPPCVRGYQATDTRFPQDTSDTRANTGARCAEPRGSNTDVRGNQNVPSNGVPPAEPGSRAYQGGAPAAANPAPAPAGPNSGVNVGTQSGDAQLLGDRSWLGPLLAGLAG